MTIQAKIEGGRVENISLKKFYRIFGARYSLHLRLPPVLPDSFLAACAKYRHKPALGEKMEADYRNKIAVGRIAPSYIAKISAEVGFGLFALQDIKKGDMIGEYAGVLTRNWSPSVNRSGYFKPYLLRFPFPTVYAIDSEKEGNETRFINHSSKNDNAARLFILYRGVLRAIFVARKTILKHDQILLDYGKNYRWPSAPSKFSAFQNIPQKKLNL